MVALPPLSVSFILIFLGKLCDNFTPGAVGYRRDT